MAVSNVRSYELRAHHLQYFHNNTEDIDEGFREVLKAMRKWMGDVGYGPSIESVNVKYLVAPDGEQSCVVGTVEYVQF